MQTLLDAKPPGRLLSPKASRRLFLAAGGLGLAAAAIGGPQIYSAYSGWKDDNLASAVFSYLVNPDFVNERFCQQVTGTEAWLDSVDMQRRDFDFNILARDMKTGVINPKTITKPIVVD